MRSGVPSDRSLCRVSKNPASVSGPAAPGTSRAPAGEWNVWLLLYENVGDQVNTCPRLIGAGVSVTRGKFCWTRSLARFWERLPPRLNVPQSKRLSKFTDEVTWAVERYGSGVLRCTTCGLVKQSTLALKRVRLSNAWLCCHPMRLDAGAAPSSCFKRV